MAPTLAPHAALILASLTFVNAAAAGPFEAVKATGGPSVATGRTLVAQQCWRRHGQLYCSHRSRGGPGDEGYYVHDANKLPFGTMQWRDQMRRENRLGNPG